MESKQNGEVGESNTRPSSSTGEVGSSIPARKLSFSFSSGSDSSVDSSFELIVDVPGRYIDGTSDSRKTNEDSDFVFVSGNDIETRPLMTDLFSSSKTSHRSLSGSENDKDTSALRPSDNVETGKDLKTESGSASDNSLPDNPSSSSGNVVPGSINGNVQSRVTPTHVKDSSSGSEVATQSPPTQVMERVGDPTSSEYRIPSHVFARNKSNTDWSAASNESLFSIQMGNMSFTKEQLSWLGKSGELCWPGDSPLPQLSNVKHSDCGLKVAQPNCEMAATEALSAETMREVIRENLENEIKESSSLTESPSQTTLVSRQSEESAKSFQFPILAGDGGKSISLKVGDPVKAKEEKKPESAQQASNPETRTESSSEESPKPAANVGPKRWFSCFSCCPFCK